MLKNHLEHQGRRSCEKWIYLQTTKHKTTNAEIHKNSIYPFLDTPSGKTRTTSSSSIAFMHQHIDDVGEDDRRQTTSSTLPRWSMAMHRLKRKWCEMPQVTELRGPKSWKPPPVSPTMDEMEPTKREPMWSKKDFLRKNCSYNFHVPLHPFQREKVDNGPKLSLGQSSKR